MKISSLKMQKQHVNKMPKTCLIEVQRNSWRAKVTHWKPSKYNLWTKIPLKKLFMWGTWMTRADPIRKGLLMGLWGTYSSNFLTLTEACGLFSTNPKNNLKAPSIKWNEYPKSWPRVSVIRTQGSKNLSSAVWLKEGDTEEAAAELCVEGKNLFWWAETVCKCRTREAFAISLNFYLLNSEVGYKVMGRVEIIFVEHPGQRMA